MLLVVLFGCSEDRVATSIPLRAMTGPRGVAPSPKEVKHVPKTISIRIRVFHKDITATKRQICARDERRDGGGSLGKGSRLPRLPLGMIRAHARLPNSDV